MIGMNSQIGVKVFAFAAFFLAMIPVRAQEPTQEPSAQEPAPPAPQGPARRADGKRHGDLPAEAYAVVPGTKFLVRLEDELDTRETRDKARFKVVTLEPLEAGSGIYLPAGAEIRGLNKDRIAKLFFNPPGRLLFFFFPNFVLQRNIRNNQDSFVASEAFCHFLIHRDSRCEDAASNIGKIGQLK